MPYYTETTRTIGLFRYNKAEALSICSRTFDPKKIQSRDYSYNYQRSLFFLNRICTEVETI